LEVLATFICILLVAFEVIFLSKKPSETLGCLAVCVFVLGVAFFVLNESALALAILVAGLVVYWIGYNFGEKSGKRQAQSLAEKQRSEDLAKLNQRMEELDALENNLKSKQETFDSQIKTRIENADRRLQIMRDGIHHLRDETLQTYPWLAKLYADYVSMYDGSLEQQLRDKARPAVRSADSVAAIAREKRTLQQAVKMLEYQLHFYETAFPWLEEFKELDPKTAYDLASNAASDSEDDSTIRHHLLSPSEYTSLSTAEKYQLALDRYVRRNKNAWQVGIEYERYVGYLFEMDGYNVKYHGALTGLGDLGRDLIASKDGSTIIIQCKRWSKTKTIHEKHIFQLFGSKVSWEIENKGKKADAILYCTTAVSDVARRYADYLGVKIAIKELSSYPLIKCNIGHDGEKIYHLPFDQHYDRLYITPSKGDLYVSTVAEAERLGFRRAYRWHGSG